MAELDKFKRRMIRAVARLMQDEKKPEDEMWEDLKKETGCDCKLLWKRMRALTLKKLNRLLLADDRNENIAAVARLSLTDWLMFDLVLVHEKIDVISVPDKKSKSEYRPLVELFSLVQRFGIEGKSHENLADAWSRATMLYNSQGHQVTPMLLQRRWYQLKEVTRSRFYKFWTTYRGIAKHLDKAKEESPTALHVAIARRYPEVIVEPFLQWEEGIKKRLIILSDEFENKLRSETDHDTLEKVQETNEPDIVLMEPAIEIIDLDEDSDSEDQNPPQTYSDPEKSNKVSDNNLEQVPNVTLDPGITIKTEPVDTEIDGLSNVKIVETTHISTDEESYQFNDTPTCKKNVQDLYRNVTMNVEMEESQIENEENVSSNLEETNLLPSCDTLPVSTDLAESVENNINDNVAQSIVNVNNIIKETTSDFNSSKIDLTKIVAIVDDSMLAQQTDSKDDVTAIEDADDDVIEMKTDNCAIKLQSNVPSVKYIKMEVTTDDVVEMKTDISSIKLTCDELPLKSEVIDLYSEIPVDVTVVDDGIEFIDDGIALLDEESETAESMDSDMDIVTGITKKLQIKTEFIDKIGESAEMPKFDLKLLMDPVVYTKKIDHMNCLMHGKKEIVGDSELITKIIEESKPVSNKAVNVKDLRETDNISQTSINDDKRDNDDLFKNESSEYESDSESDIKDDQKIKMSSYLLQKPKRLSYNPIQLCKNPDFNTRLKRLTVGFLSSARNRQFLNICKPMTVDVSKAFEPKLISGTLYLKEVGDAVMRPIDFDKSNQMVSVVPSAMSVQSLLDSSKMDINDLLSKSVDEQHESDVRPLNEDNLLRGRNKVISLPDIECVRRINQKLLTAEVTPIRIDNNETQRPPVVLTSSPPPSCVRSISQKLLTAEVSPLRIDSSGTDRPPVILTSSTPPLLQAKSPEAPILQNTAELASVTEKTSNSDFFSTDVTSEQCKISESELTPKKATDLITSYEVYTHKSLQKESSKNSLRPETNKLQNKKDHELRSIIQQRKKRSKERTTKIKKNCHVPGGVAWLPFYNAPVSWIPQNKDPDNYDFLLTTDTLLKVLKVLAGKDDDIKSKKIDKNKAKRLQKVFESEYADVLAKTETNEELTAVNKRTEKQAKLKKPKINIIEGGDQPKRIRSKKLNCKYCCWCRANMENIHLPSMIPHLCPLPICNCCCQEQFLKQFNKNKVEADASSLDSFLTKTKCDKSVTTDLPPLVSISTKKNKIEIDKIMPLNSDTVLLSDDEDDCIESTKNISDSNYRVSVDKNKDDVTDETDINVTQKTNNYDVSSKNDSSKYSVASLECNKNLTSSDNSIHTSNDEMKNVGVHAEKRVDILINKDDVEDGTKVNMTKKIRNSDDSSQIYLSNQQALKVNENSTSFDSVFHTSEDKIPDIGEAIRDVEKQVEVLETENNVSKLVNETLQNSLSVKNMHNRSMLKTLLQKGVDLATFGATTSIEDVIKTANSISYTESEVIGLDINDKNITPVLKINIKLKSSNCDSSSTSSSEINMSENLKYTTTQEPDGVLLAKPHNNSYDCENAFTFSDKTTTPIMPIPSGQRHLIVDGTQSCLVPEKMVGEDRIVFLNGKKISKTTNSPIFLGKNKILLSSAKFPEFSKTCTVSNAVVGNAEVIPTQMILNGVHLILLPSGEITFTLKPGAELNADQLASLPAIIAAVQQQINTTAIPSSTVNTVNVINANNTQNVETDIIDVDNVQNAQVVDAVDSHIQALTIKPIDNNNISADVDSVVLKLNKSNENTIQPSEKINSLVKFDDSGNSIYGSANAINNINQNIHEAKEHCDSNHIIEFKSAEKENASETLKKINVEVMSEPTDKSVNVDCNNSCSNICNNFGKIIDESSKEKKNLMKNLKCSDVEVKSNDNIHNKICDPENIAADSVDLTKEGNQLKKKCKETILNEESEQRTKSYDQETTKVDQTYSLNQHVERTLDTDDTNTTRKTILSDLMAMSGISSEDVASVPEIYKESDKSTNTLKDMNTIQLSPVTTIDELKYACEQNGKFFKLDLDTGSLVAINVCIKKNVSPRIKRDKDRTLMPKTVIDLTDDVDSNSSYDSLDTQSKPKYKKIFPKPSGFDTTGLSKKMTTFPKKMVQAKKRYFKFIANETIKLQRNDRPTILRRGGNISVEKSRMPLKRYTVQKNEVKPLKLYKFTPPKQQEGRIRELKYNQCNNIENHIKSFRLKRKRKQDMDKIEAKIDLVDSDAPVEEEYLVDSFDSDFAQDDNNDSYSDMSENDSDDEPLAKKVMRNKEVAERLALESGARVDKGPSSGIEKEATLNEQVNPESNETELSEKLVSHSEADLPMSINFIESDDDASQDDCILGF